MTSTLTFLCGSLAGSFTTGLVLLIKHNLALQNLHAESIANLAEMKRKSYAAGYHDRAMLELKTEVKKP